MKKTINELWIMTRGAVACIFAFVSAVFGVLAYIFKFIGMMYAKIGRIPYHASVIMIRIANKVAFGSTNRMVIGKVAKHIKN